eukprot:GILI01007511.1.p1 GENE.GILI01007511.1~~GILI01007511.1.p1  ORF type:complete len:347 (-),score=100.82 GILI01007511.1:211-1251(-)
MKTFKVLSLFLLVSVASAISDGSLPDNYQSFAALHKRDHLWKRILEDKSSEEWPSALAIFKMLFWDMRKVFDEPSDVRPFAGRVAHVVGAYAKAKFVPRSGSKYTGMYSSGAPAILRLSTATEPSASGDGSMIPAVAVKMFRDGDRSANYAAMYTFGPTDGHNFFKFPLCTHGPRKGGNIGLQILAWAFDKISKVSSTCGGTMQLANQTSTGAPVPREKIRVPFALILQPNPKLREAMEGFQGAAQMAGISERVGAKFIGQSIYKVLAVTGPEWPGKDSFVHIGDYVLESEITTSLWGDRYLFFQQQLFDEELELYPAWKEQVTPDFLEEEGLPYKYEQGLPEWKP